ncbi:MAG: hypothetical protein HPY62_09145 [Bacteroidales bacterium]|nr:hypothetical protein [Bacteroidales bacterium]
MKILYLRLSLLSVLLLIASLSIDAQTRTGLIRIDKNGRMLWTNNNKEAYFWGVNYTTPFAHAFRQIERMGYDHRKVIDMDTYHLARLGINAYRVHVWDCEISDGDGNLIANEHLDLLDYLIFKLEERGIYVFLTPIAYWGNGYPEPNEQLPGFSMKYNKSNVYLEPQAIAAQERYLKQFVSHVNKYTGLSYSEDPMLIGFEICNEPGHSKPAETTFFVKRMIKAVRSAGCKKPVFYNITQNISLLEDFIKGGTDGVTFQWYPAGLVAGHEIKGNYLPYVDIYDMPFRNEKYFKPQARLVYEFDAADVGRSYMYPPIALSFKEAGMQWVTMFSYDPAVMASINTEYQTHFLNLLCSPQKAVGFKIAGEVFRNPQFRRDRENETKPFETKGLKISYSEDLSELVTGELYYHTGNTETDPPDRSSLRSVAGYGSSPIVSYKGYGAYFLDRIGEGVWRLEVMPDAVWVRDPFSRATPRIENVLIKWNKYEMSINLPDLGSSFYVKGINNGNSYSVRAENGRFEITPGAYVLSSESPYNGPSDLKMGAIRINEYHALPESENKFYFIHKAPRQVSENQSIEVTVRVVSPPLPIRQLVIQPFMTGFRGRGGYRPVLIPMKKTDNYDYKAVIPDSLVRAGILYYSVNAELENGEVYVYPGGVKGPSNSWDYYNPETYSVRVLPAGSEIQIFHAEENNENVIYFNTPAVRTNTLVSGVTGGTRMKISINAENNSASRTNSSGIIYLIHNYIGETIKSISGYAEKYSEIYIDAKASDKPVRFVVSLISKDGNAYSAPGLLSPDRNGAVIDLKSLEDGMLFLLPRPYPVFLPFWYTSKFKKPFSLQDIERVQFMIPEDGNENATGFEISSIILR